MDYQEEINLINFFTRNKNLTQGQQRRFKHLLARDLEGYKPQQHSINKNEEKKNVFEEARNKYNPLTTADFLSLFGAPSGLKFLTHDFDPNSGMSMTLLLKQVDEILKDWKNNIPDSLRKLMIGFIQKGNWIDYKGMKHKFFLKEKSVAKWCEENPSLNPIISNEFGFQIQDFRNTVRLSQPNLEPILSEIIQSNNNLCGLNITTDKLNRADFYTNVLVLRKILRTILLDIAQRDQQANVKIDYIREIFDNSYRSCIIRITHLGSEANTFEEVKNKLIAKGGALYNIFESCIGYCDWAIEAIFENEPKRWNIINLTQKNEFEEIEKPQGFTHILTFYKKIY